MKKTMQFFFSFQVREEKNVPYIPMPLYHSIVCIEKSNKVQRKEKRKEENILFIL